MRVLIIEDDVFKATKIDALMRALGAGPIEQRASYTSGLQAIKAGGWDLCIMDMSLPTFDVSPVDEGYDTLSYGGDLLLREMKRRGIALPTIVVTQFTTFPEKLEEKSLAELSAELDKKYTTNYLGCIFYADEETSWQSEIEQIVRSLIK